MGVAKGKKPSKSKGGIGKKVLKTGKQLLAGKAGGGGKRRRKGPDYWAKKVLVERLKKKFNKLKYGGR